MFRRLVSEGVALRGRWALLVALAIPFAACESTLEVRDKEFLTPAGTSTQLLVDGAVADFNGAYSGPRIPGGNADAFLAVSELLSDNLYSAGTFTTRTATDQRDQFPLGDGNTGDAAYAELHQARRAAIRAFRALSNDGQGSSANASLMKMYEGFTYIALGEGYCSGIPFGEVSPEGELTQGVPISTSQIFEEAIPLFDQALSIDGSNYAAAVGKGRALMNLGRYSEAAAAVASVPTTYTKPILHSDNSPNQVNAIWQLHSNGRYGFGVTPNSPDAVRDRKDPRMPYVDGGPGFDEQLTMYVFLPLSVLRGSPVMLADGIEARLIEAEADLAAGGTQWLTILNTLRADVDNLMAGKYPNYSSVLATAEAEGNVTPLTTLVDPGSASARVDLIFNERQAWMALTGHRLGDLRRLIRQYGRAADDVFPSGTYYKFGEYGTDVNLPLDFDEQNNPNWNIGLCSYSTP